MTTPLAPRRLPGYDGRQRATLYAYEGVLNLAPQEAWRRTLALTGNETSGGSQPVSATATPRGTNPLLSAPSATTGTAASGTASGTASSAQPPACM